MDTQMMDIAKVAVTALTPFLPFLLDMAREGGQKLVDVMAEKGGDEAWKTAQNLWNKITGQKGDSDIEDAARITARQPDDPGRQVFLETLLTQKLKQSPALADEILEILSKGKSVQVVSAEQESQVENIEQKTSGRGDQRVSARGKSTIKGIKQTRT